MYDELTVLENLTFSALLFNKRGFRRSREVIPMVHHSMELLGLSFVKHSIVGRYYCQRFCCQICFLFVCRNVFITFHDQNTTEIVRIGAMNK